MDGMRFVRSLLMSGFMSYFKLSFENMNCATNICGYILIDINTVFSSTLRNGLYKKLSRYARLVIRGDIVTNLSVY